MGKFRRTVGDYLTNGPRRLCGMSLHDGECAPFEGRSPGEQLIRSDAQGILITRSGEGSGVALFGAHVQRCSQYSSRHRECVLRRHLRDAEVGDDRVTIRIEHDVRRLDVAVDHASPVRVRQRRANLKKQGANNGERQRSPCRQLGPVGLLQRPTRDILHREQVQILQLPDRVDRDNVGVREIGLCDRLGVEAIHHPRNRHHRGGHHLHGHASVERALGGQKHRRLSAAPEFANDLVVARSHVSEPRF